MDKLIKDTQVLKTISKEEKLHFVLKLSRIRTIVNDVHNIAFMAKYECIWLWLKMRSSKVDDMVQNISDNEDSYDLIYYEH